MNYWAIGSDDETLLPEAGHQMFGKACGSMDFAVMGEPRKASILRDGVRVKAWAIPVMAWETYVELNHLNGRGAEQQAYDDATFTLTVTDSDLRDNITFM